MFQTILSANFAIINTFQYVITGDTTAGLWAIVLGAICLISLTSKVRKLLNK